MGVFGQLAVVMGLAAVAGVAAKLLRQPALLGYIVAGIAVSAWGITSGVSQGVLVSLLGQLGVTLLLFLVGLELPIAQLKQLGKVALITGLGQIVVTAAVGYPILLALGLGKLPSIYLAIALAFSSTIVIVKLLTEKKDLQSLPGKIAVGYLLVQDFVAIGILIVLAGMGTAGNIDWPNLGWAGAKGALLVGVSLWLSGQVLPRVLVWLGESAEMLFVAAIAWCIAVAAIVASPSVGFSLEIGGFLAGLALSGAAQHLQIGARVRPLRDFFLTLFFVSLGANIHLMDLARWWWPAVVLALFVIVVKPLIMMIIMGGLGYQKRTSFSVAVTSGQISEFSLIVMAAAARVGQVGQIELALTAMVGAVTMIASSHLIINEGWLYQRLVQFLGVFERRHLRGKAAVKTAKLVDHIVLVGHNRIGSVLYPVLSKLGHKTMVVDFDPHRVEELVSQGIEAVYGDLADFDLYTDLGLARASLIISTVSSPVDNLQFLQYVKGGRQRPVTVVTAGDKAEAEALYQGGADYVLIPHAVGGEYLAHVIAQHGISRDALRKLR